MPGAIVVSIVFGAIVLALAVLGATLLLAIKLIKGGASRTDPKRFRDEEKLFQEIDTGLSRLEQRVEALETILSDQNKEKDGHP
jgi:hypothetical protein